MMRDILGPRTILGYCTNVHAGTSWEQFTANLKQYAARVKQIVTPESGSSMPIGLWMSAPTAHDMLRNESTHDLGALLDELGLIPFTINGFPYADFHQPIVKHAVYRPTWGGADRERFEYTMNLAGILTERGQLDEALATAREGLPLLKEMDWAWSHLDHVALRAALAGKLTNAARLAGFADSANATKKTSRQPNEARARNKLHKLLCEKFAAEELTRLLAEGATMSEEDACRRALEE